jgi:hypothetical protein
MPTQFACTLPFQLLFENVVSALKLAAFGGALNLCCILVLGGVPVTRDACTMMNVPQPGGTVYYFEM